jgi:hypothetical protein
VGIVRELPHEALRGEVRSKHKAGCTMSIPCHHVHFSHIPCAKGTVLPMFNLITSTRARTAQHTQYSTTTFRLILHSSLSASIFYSYRKHLRDTIHFHPLDHHVE